VKPIETPYKGYRFRSRLEARWAVFFDAMGISYEYEPEGFDLGDGVWYLPDFLLHFKERDVFVEIKPENYATKMNDHFKNEKIRKFCMESDKEIVLCMGMPDKLTLTLKKQDTQIWIDDYNSDPELQKKFPNSKPEYKVFLHMHPISFVALGIERFKKALELARSARFDRSDKRI